jgi:hypothetical protein
VHRVYIGTKTGYVVYEKTFMYDIILSSSPLPKAARYLTSKKLMQCTICLYALLCQIYINHIPFTSYNNGSVIQGVIAHAYESIVL